MNIRGILPVGGYNDLIHEAYYLAGTLVRSFLLFFLYLFLFLKGDIGDQVQFFNHFLYGLFLSSFEEVSDV